MDTFRGPTQMLYIREKPAMFTGLWLFVGLIQGPTWRDRKFMNWYMCDTFSHTIITITAIFTLIITVNSQVFPFSLRFSGVSTTKMLISDVIVYFIYTSLIPAQQLKRMDSTQKCEFDCAGLDSMWLHDWDEKNVLLTDSPPFTLLPRVSGDRTLIY